MNEHYEWAVVGAGPAGIAAVGKLLESGISPTAIAWLDPNFKAGDLGEKWQCVPSNTKVGLFKQFLEGCSGFEFETAPEPMRLTQFQAEDTCLLKEVAVPLRWVTAKLQEKVKTYQVKVDQLLQVKNGWSLTCNQVKLTSERVILAIGSESRQLNYPGIEVVPLENALDAEKIKTAILPSDQVAVFGSSHSAVLVLKNLCEMEVKKVHNFYKSPNKYALYLPDRILFDNTGLKGAAATWARKNLEGDFPSMLLRHFSNPHTIQEYLPHCNKVVYAVGFKPRLLDAGGLDLSNYNDKYGVIAPGLFGVGIAYPERRYDAQFDSEYSVGLWKFMDYLNRVLPIWLRY